MDSLASRFFIALDSIKRLHKMNKHPHLRPGENMVASVLFKNRDKVKGLKASEIARTIDASPQSVTFILNSMEGQNLIERKMGKTDRRSVYVKLTKKGEDVFFELMKEHEDLLMEIVEEFGEADVEEFIRLLGNFSNFIYEKKQNKGEN